MAIKSIKQRFDEYVCNYGTPSYSTFIDMAFKFEDEIVKNNLKLPTFQEILNEVKSYSNSKLYNDPEFISRVVYDYICRKL